LNRWDTGGDVSTFICPVVKIGKIGKHPQADTLSLSQVGGYTCIFRTGGFKEGDLAIYISEESLVPETQQWAFLWTARTNDNQPVRERDRVVKAKKLRGIFSCGLIIPLPPGDPPPVGTDMAPLLGITKYEAPEEVRMGGDNAPTPGWLPRFTEIENARGLLFNQGDPGIADRDQFLLDKIRADLFNVGEEVLISEKIHGCNTRYAVHAGQYVIGSHNNVKANDSSNVWTSVGKRLDMEGRCRKMPGFILFGEVYGQVQKGYSYGLKSPSFILFDIFDITVRRYLDWDKLEAAAKELDLPLVPVLYRGPWVSLDHAASFSDGPSVLARGLHNREGCVVRAVPERWDVYLGRMCLKLVGETYLLKKYS
jgi:RNA ligase (TIGR02306 family)